MALVWRVPGNLERGHRVTGVKLQLRISDSAK